MQVIDWCHADPGVVQACYARETAHWREAFSWDTHGSWEIVERARTHGLPGCLVADAAGTVRGWMFTLVSGGGVQVGGVVADDEKATALMVQAVLSLAQDAGADYISAFMPVRAPKIEDVLRRSRFSVTPFRYLTR